MLVPITDSINIGQLVQSWVIFISTNSLRFFFFGQYLRLKAPNNGKKWELFVWNTFLFLFSLYSIIFCLYSIIYAICYSIRYFISIFNHQQKITWFCTPNASTHFLFLRFNLCSCVKTAPLAMLKMQIMTTLHEFQEVFLSSICR